MSPRHAPPSGQTSELPEKLYDTNVPTPNHAEQALTLAALQNTGTLCTFALKPEGFPYGSFVIHAVHDNNPVFLISAIAEHTANLMKNSKASFLVCANSGAGNPLAHARATLIGECRKVEAHEIDSVKKTFLDKHPSAKHYVDFKDFSFWKLHTDSVRYIGGFGNMSWVDSEAWYSSEPDPIAPVSEDIIQHMNKDHSDTMHLYCQTYTRAHNVESVKMTAIDRYGFDMQVLIEEASHPIRLGFEKPIKNAEEARMEMVRLAKEARIKNE